MKSAIKNREAIKKQLSSKERRLNEVLDTNPPIVETLLGAYLRRQENAFCFLNELDEVTFVLDSDNDVVLVNKAEFDNLVESADTSNIEFDGVFCKLALLQTFPEKDKWALFVAPVESI
ncbi:MAG: hypothetical protein E7311_03380 [Clostridiales bacterium]|nr:hypothetical protein [Clostridiales bacterium]